MIEPTPETPTQQTPTPEPPQTPTPPAPVPTKGKRVSLTPEQRAQRAEAARLKREGVPTAAPAEPAEPAAPVPAPAVAPAVAKASGVRRLAKPTPVYVSSGRKRTVLIPARKRIITHTISTPTSSRPK